MAVSSLKLTVEEKNYWKFCMLNIRVVPDALRNYFDGLIPPTRLATTINQNTRAILNLVNRRVINSAQLDILQRIPGTIWPLRCPIVATASNASSSADFDVTLMVCLLRNIPLPGIYQPASGWNNLPIPNDTTPGAYLSRIKYYRNEIAHSTETKLNTLDFQDKWKTISEAIIFCNGGHCPNAIMDILHCDLDGSRNGVNVTCLMTEIEAVKRDLIQVEGELQRTELQLENVQSDFHFYKDGHLPKNISDNIHELINKWRIDDKPFFFTRAGKLVYDMLESENIVVIIGQSGSGKSATARNVALRWITYGYDVVPVESAGQILEYRCKETKQIFVIDDAVGKYSVNGSYVNQWESLDSKLTTIFVDKNAKLICTLRKVVAIDTKFKTAKTCLSHKAYIIDVDHEDTCLLLEEKMSILKNHLNCTGRQNDLSDEVCKECCKTNFAFPLLCHIFTTSDGLFKRKSSFFRKPLSYVNDEIAKLHKRNKKVYCSLVMCMIYSGKISTDIFSVSDDSREKQDKSGRILGMIAEACGLHRNISRQTLLDSLHSVEGVYINMSFGKIKFLHDFFLEAVSFHFSKVNTRVLLECCDNNFLVERVRVISPNVNDDQNVIVLEEESYFHLACRFIAELEKGFSLHILWSQPIRHANFLKVMIQLIESGHIITKQKLMNSKFSCENASDWRFYTPVIRHGVETTLVVFPSEKTFLHWIICTGCHKLFDYFWKTMSKKQQRRFVRADNSLFPLSLLSGCKEIIKQILESGADVKSPGSQYALKYLVENERHTELIEFLIRNGIGMNFTDYKKKSPLYYAITNKNMTILAFLVEKDSQQNPLHEAVYNSNIHKTKHLLQSVSIKLVSKNGWSVFHFAAYNNDVAIMDIIIEYAIKSCQDLTQSFVKILKFTDIIYAINTRDKLGWTPLHLASALCKYEVVDFLMRKGADAHLVDLDGKKPFHFASNKRIASFLLKQSHCAKELLRKESIRTFENERHSYEDDDFRKELDDNMKNWQPSVISLIYVTCMNFLFLLVSIVKLRKKIDIPDSKGNTLLHAAAMMKREDDSIESIQMLLKRGANPLFYNTTGYLPNDIAFYRSFYKVKRFLDIYTMHAAKRCMSVLVIMSIITFLLVIFLCLVPFYVFPSYENNDVYNNSYYMYTATTCILFDYPNSTLHSDVNFNPFTILAVNQTNADNLHGSFPLLYIFHILSILCVLSFDILFAICKKLLWRHNCFFENIYIGVHTTTLLHVMFICFPSQSILIVLKDMVVIFLLMYLTVLGYEKVTMLIQRHSLGLLIFSTGYFKFLRIFYIIIPVLSIYVCFVYVMFLSKISVLLGNLFNFSVISIFIFTFIGIYIYMNIFSGCAYFIFLKILEKYITFPHLSDRFQIKTSKLLYALRILIKTKPLISWHITFKFVFLFILLFTETLMFYNTYQDRFYFRNLLNKSNPVNLTVEYSYTDLYNILNIFFDIFLFTVSIKTFKYLQRLN